MGWPVPPHVFVCSGFPVIRTKDQSAERRLIPNNKYLNDTTLQKRDAQTRIHTSMETAVKKYPEVCEILQPRLEMVAAEKGLAYSGFKRFWHRLTRWETWDWRIKYVFIAPVWGWCCIRARSPWFFTAANPTLTFGGFDGESKMEMYTQLPPGTYPRSILIHCEMSFEKAWSRISQSGLRFPLAVKPDVGKMGLMFRRINSCEELRYYHGHIRCHYIAQEFVDYPLELSIFYYRMPGHRTGTITGFIRKDFLEVTGDGASTLWQMILAHPRAQFRLSEMRSKHEDKLDWIIPAGCRYFLSRALNLSRGGRLVSLEDQKDHALLKVFDDISHYTGNFYYGRYDVKCQSIEDLKQGKNFSILEYNGSGAEPHHVYGNGYSLSEACSILAQHWEMLYRISQANRRNGIPYWTFSRGWKFLRETSKHLDRLLRRPDQV